MAKHKPMCLIINILVVVGAVNWGLVGLGMLMNSDWNVVNMLLGQWPTVEAIVYLLVGVAGLALGWMACCMKDCACEKM